MFILHESIWWVAGMGAVGLYLGYLKGMARWGLLLGLLFGPLGWAITLFLPVRLRVQGAFRARGSSRPGPAPADFAGPAPEGSGCPRCGKGVGRGDKACAHCGNLLVPIRYRVLGPSGS